MTKKEYYEALLDIVTEEDSDVLGIKNELIDFINREIDMINARAERNKARNAAKKAEGDILQDRIAGLLDDNLQTIDELTVIYNEMYNDDVSRNKVAARLSKLVNGGIASKENIKDGTRNVMAYKRAYI